MIYAMNQCNKDDSMIGFPTPESFHLSVVDVKGLAKKVDNVIHITIHAYHKLT